MKFDFTFILLNEFLIKPSKIPKHRWMRLRLRPIIMNKKLIRCGKLTKYYNKGFDIICSNVESIISWAVYKHLMRYSIFCVLYAINLHCNTVNVKCKCNNTITSQLRKGCTCLTFRFIHAVSTTNGNIELHYLIANFMSHGNIVDEAKKEKLRHCC